MAVEQSKASVVDAGGPQFELRPGQIFSHLVESSFLSLFSSDIDKLWNQSIEAPNFGLWGLMWNVGPWTLKSTWKPIEGESNKDGKM